MQVFHARTVKQGAYEAVDYGCEYCVWSARVYVQGVGKKEMKSGEQPIVGASKVFERPGVYSLEVRPSGIMQSTCSRFENAFLSQ